MSSIKKTFLYGMLVSCLAVMPFSMFAMPNNVGNDAETIAQTNSKEIADGFRFGVYYGRPYYHRPYYYYAPYRPYYYRSYYYPYGPYHYYRW